MTSEFLAYQTQSSKFALRSFQKIEDRIEKFIREFVNTGHVTMEISMDTDYSHKHCEVALKRPCTG